MPHPPHFPEIPSTASPLAQPGEGVGPLHWAIYSGPEWDGNWLALEPIESYRPACGARTNDPPRLADTDDCVTCKRCRRILRKAMDAGHE
jgi:hypothetical protein